MPGSDIHTALDRYTIYNFLLLPNIKVHLRFHLIIGMPISHVPLEVNLFYLFYSSYVRFRHRLLNVLLLA